MVPAIRQEAAGVDALVPIEKFQTMQENVNRSISTPRLRRTLLALFAAVAVLLSALGVYGLISLVVVERRREIGIRMALGATLAEARWIVVSNALAWTGAGVLVGLGAAYAASRWLESLLYGVQPGDGLVYLAATILFVLVAAMASYLPVRRITSQEPMTVLRDE
jgi:ABC-type antimicrobial peptide transport system permease subunit